MYKKCAFFSIAISLCLGEGYAVVTRQQSKKMRDIKVINITQENALVAQRRKAKKVRENVPERSHGMLTHSQIRHMFLEPSAPVIAFADNMLSVAPLNLSQAPVLDSLEEQEELEKEAQEAVLSDAAPAPQSGHSAIRSLKNNLNSERMLSNEQRLDQRNDLKDAGLEPKPHVVPLEIESAHAQASKQNTQPSISPHVLPVHGDAKQKLDIISLVLSHKVSPPPKKVINSTGNLLLQDPTLNIIQPALTSDDQQKWHPKKVRRGKKLLQKLAFWRKRKKDTEE